MKDLLFLLADLFMIVVGFRYGWRFIRRYGNYLLGLEWMVVATSGSNFLLWSLISGDEGHLLYDVAYFFDAFSRSVGITLILVLGLMHVTHHYRPSRVVDVGAFGLAIAAGLYLQQFRGHELHVGPATYYLVVNLLTTGFLAYFCWRVWSIGARGTAVAAGIATAAATAIALMYDFFPFPDDEHRTVFYVLALSTWGLQMLVGYRAYAALHGHDDSSGATSAAEERKAARA